MFAWLRRLTSLRLIHWILGAVTLIYWSKVREMVGEVVSMVSKSASHCGRGFNAAAADGDLVALTQKLRNGTISSEDLTKRYIARIQQIDGIVKSIAQLNPDAVLDAAQLDKERSSGKIQGILHGVPILVKDTFNTLDKMGTTAGSLALKGARPSKEATVITRLRDAGAVILGKTALTQWSNTRSSKQPNGWSSMYGQCYGAYHGKQDPQGSSSGCAVAASLGLAAATVGAETWASIIYPAQRNSVVGLKPTVGLVPRSDVIQVSEYKDSIGPITRTVKDTAILLTVLAGFDKADKETESIPFERIPDYPAACKLDALQNARIAVSTSALKTVSDREVLQSFEEALATISSLGGEVIRNGDFESWIPGAGQRENLTFSVLLRDAIETYFKNLDLNPHNIHTMGDLVKFIEDTKEEEAELYGIDMFVAARDEQHNKSSPEFLDGIKTMRHLGGDIQRLLDKTDCDVLAMPTSADVPYDLGQNPVISVPLGFYSSNQKVVQSRNGMIAKGNNIPYSISFVGRKFSEEKLIGIAYAFEQATKVWCKGQPCIASTIELFPSAGGHGADANL